MRGGLGAFEGGLGLFHAGFEGFQLALADALDGEAQGGLLAGYEGLGGGVPPRAAVLGEAAGAYGFAAGGQAGAGGDGGAVKADFGFEVDAAGEANGELAGVELLTRRRGGYQGFDGGLVGGAGGYPGEGDFFARYGGRWGLPADQGALAPVGGPLIGVDFVFELGALAVGYVAELLAPGANSVRQAAGQVGQGVDARLFDAQYVAYRAFAAILAVDVAFQLALRHLAHLPTPHPQKHVSHIKNNKNRYSYISLKRFNASF